MAGTVGNTVGLGGNFRCPCSPSTAAYLSQALQEGQGAYRVVVLATPQSYRCTQTAYAGIHGCEVRPLFFSVADLTPALWASLLLLDASTTPPHIHEWVWRVLSPYPDRPGAVDFRKIAEELRALPLQSLDLRWMEGRLNWVEGLLLEMVAWNAKAVTAIRNFESK